MRYVSEPLGAVAPGFPVRLWTAARVLVALVISSALVSYGVWSWHWPLIHDMQVMHYVSFLIDRGWAPYRQIHDMNMPGAYLFEGWALHLFGRSDVGWRMYDFSLCAVLIAAMIVIARRYDWLAGLVAGGTFALVHGSEGAMNAGQRDQVMAVTLMAGYAFCFEAVRRRRPWMMLPFGLVVAMAAAVKPTLLPVGPMVLLLAVLVLRRQNENRAAYTIWAVAGFALAIAIVLEFLLAHGSLRAFFVNLTTVLPTYAQTESGGSWYLLRHPLQTSMLLYLGVAAMLAVLDRSWWNWESGALLLGALFGFVSFYAQHKGFAQHRYTLLAFALLWASIQIGISVRSPRRVLRIAAVATVALILLDMWPKLQLVKAEPRQDNFGAYLERDLEALGPERLQHNIQCLDIVDGCLNALWHLQIVQSTGATGDLSLFLPQDSPAVASARAGFLRTIKERPPEVFVLCNTPFEGPRSFHKIDVWPEFAAYLNRNYEMAKQREFDYQVESSRPWTEPPYPAYRIYIRRGSPLLASLPVLQTESAPL